MMYSSETPLGSAKTGRKANGGMKDVEMSAEQEYFLYELETTDSGSMGLVLRAIYDTGDVQQLARALQQRISHYDKNIQIVCSFHYQSFVDAMQELMKLKEQCQDIKDETVAIDAEIQQIIKRFAIKRDATFALVKHVYQSSDRVEKLQVCLPVLENYAKLQEQMSNKKYYQALKTLEELERVSQALVEKYRFTQVLAKSMTPVRLEIKEKAYSEFKDFLENIKKVAGRIGKHASKDTAEQHSFGVTDAERARKLQEEARKNASNVEIEVSADGSIVKKNVSPKRYPQTQIEEDEQVSAQDLIDFTPVHRCCQIFNVLGAKEEFEQYYRQQRREQCDLVIEPSHNMNNFKHYVEYLDEIVGFFVVEDQILMTQSNLSTNADKDKLWDNALPKIRHHLDKRFGGCPDVEMMLRMKKVILLFILTMKSYGYAVAPLYELLQNFRDQYNEILVKEYCAQFERDLDKDNYTPITVNSEEEFRAVIRQFPFYKRSMEQEQFPRKFPFSRFVISAYTQAKQYLVGCLKFMDNLQLNTSAVDGTVRRCANVLLGRWAGISKTFVHKRLSMIQLVQFTINLGYLEKSCESLGSFITSKTDGEEANRTYVFHGGIAKSMVEIRHKIKENALLEADHFLHSVKKSSGLVGMRVRKVITREHTSLIMDATSFKKLRRNLMRRLTKGDIEVSADGSIVKKNVSPKRSPQKQIEDDEQVSAQDLIDFTPIHLCCQIFNVLGAKEEFEQFFRQQRREQCDLVIEPSHKMNNFKHYVEYLDEIVGFFVVEDQILMTQSNLSTNADKDKLWDNALLRICHHLGVYLSEAPTIDALWRAKNHLVHFKATLMSLGFNTTLLGDVLEQNTTSRFDILPKILERPRVLYSLASLFEFNLESLIQMYCAQFERDLDKDNYTPITVNSEEEFRAVIRQFPFYKRSMEQEQFPRKFPFSRFVISSYTQFNQYLIGCLKFMDNLQLNTSAVDDTVRRCANVLLGRWAGILKTFVHKRLSMIQLVQITINLGYLEKSCESLGSFITSKTSGEEAIGTTSHQVVLSEKVFRDVRSEVEQQIDECMRSKVDEIMELANYDWELPAASGQASDFITDLIKFLLTTFQSFTNLPSKLAKRVCTQTCKHISNSLSDLLLSPDTKCISTGALDQFSLDVMQCEMFTTRCPVTGVDPQTLSMTFVDLRQLLDLVMSSYWTTFNAEYGKDHAKCLRAKASTAIIVLEKMASCDDKFLGFFTGVKLDHQQLFNTVVRQLKMLDTQ